jgi:hypothetical protein
VLQVVLRHCTGHGNQPSHIEMEVIRHRVTIFYTISHLVIHSTQHRCPSAVEPRLGWGRGVACFRAAAEQSISHPIA